MNIILFGKETESISSADRVYSHIREVLKLKEGDEFKSGIWGVSRGKSKILKITDVEIIIKYKKEKDDSKALRLYLFLAYIRPICAKRVCRIVGELGLKGIVFYKTKLNEKSYSESNFYKKREAEEYLREGSEISGDYIKPDLILLDDIEDLISFAKEKNITNKYLLEKDEKVEKLEKENESLSCLTIGPERGFTKAEIELLEKEGFLKRKLTDRILRSEEAAMISLFPFV